MEQFKHHVSQHKDGTYSVGVSIDQGYMTPDDFILLSELAKKYHVTTLMATTAKKISFMDVQEANVNPLWEDLEQAFGQRLCFPKGKVIVCPGSKFCKFATPGRDNHAMGREVERISKAHEAGKVKVGVSCCPLGCAMPQRVDAHHRRQRRRQTWCGERYRRRTGRRRAVGTVRQSIPIL